MQVNTYSLEPLSLAPPLRARACFPPTFPGFDGHFPGNPILPGFCHIQLAVDFLQQLHPDTTLASVDNARFTRPIRPNDPILLELTLEGTFSYVAALSVAGETCSRFHLGLRQDAPALRR